jgi:hypothetical protein
VNHPLGDRKILQRAEERSDANAREALTEAVVEGVIHQSRSPQLDRHDGSLAIGC